MLSYHIRNKIIKAVLLIHNINEQYLVVTFSGISSEEFQAKFVHIISELVTKSPLHYE